MCPKLQQRECCKPRQVLLTMLVLRFGKTVLTTKKVIFGVLAAFYLRCVHLSHHTKALTCSNCSDVFVKDECHCSQELTQKN